MERGYKYQPFKGSIMEVIKRRSSVRTYRQERLSDEFKSELKQYIADIKGPFAPKVRLEFINSREVLGKSGGKIGTYGIIKGAEDYVAAIVSAGEKDLENLGFILEKFILYVTSLGLGTCWLGGTFKRSEFTKLVQLQEDELLPIVTPIGYSGDKRSTVESIMRFAAKSDQRKNWNVLFFDESFNKALEKEDANKYIDALEAVRLAPSASNKQPWRILKKGKEYHFYLKRDKGYGKGLGFDIQRIDMGIAMCHFELVLQELGLEGSWVVKNPQEETAKSEEMDYTISWIENAK